MLFDLGGRIRGRPPGPIRLHEISIAKLAEAVYAVRSRSRGQTRKEPVTTNDGDDGLRAGRCRARFGFGGTCGTRRWRRRDRVILFWSETGCGENLVDTLERPSARLQRKRRWR
jgi:hypothetical protein